MQCIKVLQRHFPGGPVAKTLCSQSRGLRFNPWSGYQILQPAMKIKDPCAAAKTHHSQINTYFYKRCFRASSCCSTYDHQSATTLSSRNVVVVIQSVNGFQLFVTSWTAASQASLSFTISQSLLKRMFIEPVMPSHRNIYMKRGLFQGVVPCDCVGQKV